MKIYVASSWRNKYQPSVVDALRREGHQVYDFRNPPGRTGFSWHEVDSNWANWSPAEYRHNLSTSAAAEDGFVSDFNAMKDADACVLVLPCGRSAHLEAGWFVGSGKPLHVLLDTQKEEAELMYLMAGEPFSHLHLSLTELVEALAGAAAAV